MSTARGAKLKAQYNRVRTSTSLRANDMWTNTIGVSQDPQAGSNSVIESQIYAPTHGGSKRTERRELAQQLIQASGYQPSVTDYQGLLTLAKAQGSLGAGARGACKLCGGLGHLTKQCTNFLTGHNAANGAAVVVAAAAAGAPAVGAGPAGVPVQGRGLLPDPGEMSDLSDLLKSSSGSDSDDDSSGSSDSDASRDRHKKHSKKRKHSSKKVSSKKRAKTESKSGKHKKEKNKKSKKSKKSRKEASPSTSD